MRGATTRDDFIVSLEQVLFLGRSNLDVRSTMRMANPAALVSCVPAHGFRAAVETIECAGEIGPRYFDLRNGFD